MATTGLPASFTSSGISPPNPNRDCSVTAAARTVATPASTALPPSVRMRNPASTSRLFAAPTISRVPRTGGNMVWRTCAVRGKPRARLTAAAQRPPALSALIPVERLRDGDSHDFYAFQICGADAVALRQQQRVVASLKWRGATLGARIVAHHRRRDRVRRYRVLPRN